MGAKTNLGRVAIHPAGKYIPGGIYKRLDAVSHEGSSYLAKMDTDEVPTEEYAWLKLAAKGDKGDKGDSFKYADFTDAQLAALRGPVGKSFNIVGLFTTLEKLIEAVPDGSGVDGVYGVGTEAPYLYYAWVVKNGSGDWVSQGQLQGGDGKSAYEIAVQNGYVGTEAEWLFSLKGTDGVIGADGANGKSAYDLYRESVPEGTQPLTLSEWLLSLRGENGKSAYDLYVEAVPDGETPLTLEQWVASLKGADGQIGKDGTDGAPGKSAYQSYVDSVPDGATLLTEAEWAQSVTGGFDVSKIRVIEAENFDPTNPSAFEEGILYLIAVPI